MKKNLIKYSFFLLILASTTSCEDKIDNFVNQTNPNVISENNFWRDLKEIQIGLNTVYRSLYSPNIFNIPQEMMRSDLGYPGLTRPIPSSPSPFYIHTYTPSNNFLNNKWTDTYQGIFRANQVIEALENLNDKGGDEEEWTSQMAQARFFRGLYHYYIYSTFNNGQIVIKDHVTDISNENKSNVNLSSAEDVLKFIRTDLEYAYANLYKKGEYPDGNVSAVTSAAAAVMLGNTYLNELKYDEAAVYYEDVIFNHDYTLETDLDKMFTTAGEFNSESIFEINFTAENIDLNFSPWDGGTGTNTLGLYTRGNTSNTAAGPAWIVYEYKSEPKDALDSRNFYIDPLDDILKERNVPLRASAMMAVVEDFQTIYYQRPTTQAGGPSFNGRAWGGIGWWKKYTNHDIVTSEGQLPNGIAYSSKNVTLIRLSEPILNLAECKIKTGDISGGLELINQIRRRWGLVLLGPSNGDTSRTYDGDGVDGVVYTEATLMERIIKIEKPLELGAEGHASRWLDFIRWDKSEQYGFDKRVKELSEATYYGVNYPYTNSEGQARIAGNSPSILNTLPTENHIVIDYEYDLPAINFDKTKHLYYPIPSTETEVNGNTKTNESIE